MAVAPARLAARHASGLAARPRAAATTYVVAWVVGLAVLPAGPDAHGTAAEAVATLDANRGTAVLQSWLVHGLATGALAWLAVALLLLQVVLLHAAVVQADPAAPSAAAAWLHAVNLAFVWESSVLSAVLTASLVLLLAWALVVAFSVSRGAARDTSPGADGTLGAEPAAS